MLCQSLPGLLQNMPDSFVKCKKLWIPKYIWLQMWIKELRCKLNWKGKDFHLLANFQPKSLSQGKWQNCGCNFTGTAAAVTWLALHFNIRQVSCSLLSVPSEHHAPLARIVNEAWPNYQHIALFLGGSKLRLSRFIQHAVIWTLELKKKHNNNEHSI